MKRKNEYFLTEVVDPMEEAIYQYGIFLYRDQQEAVSNGFYNSNLHLKWVEKLRREGATSGWGPHHGSRETIYYPRMEGLKDVVSSAWGSIRNQRTKPTLGPGSGKYATKLLNPEVQLPIISWLHENELERIVARLDELESQKKRNPLYETLYEFTLLAKNVIEHWYVRNGKEVPRVKLVPPIKLVPSIEIPTWHQYRDSVFPPLLQELFEGGHVIQEAEIWPPKIDPASKDGKSLNASFNSMAGMKAKQRGGRIKTEKRRNPDTNKIERVIVFYPGKKD